MIYNILAAGIWAVLFFGPPMVLALGAPMYYADARENLGGHGKLHTGWVVLLFLCTLIIWTALLNLVYLPAMSYDLGNPTKFDFTNLASLQLLTSAVSTWFSEQPLIAAALLSFPLALGVATMAFARHLGIASRMKEIKGTPGYRYFFQS